MPYTYKMLGQGAVTSGAVGTFNTIYTVPSGKSVIINKIDVTNTTSNTVATVLRIVPSGATSGTSHQYTAGTTSSASGALGNYVLKTYSGPITLGAGDFIQISSDTANACNYFIFGVEIS